MEQFSTEITVGKKPKLFRFTRMENTNGVKFFITSFDLEEKAISFSMKQNGSATDWKLIPGSQRWLYEIEEDLSDAIINTRLS